MKLAVILLLVLLAFRSGGARADVSPGSTAHYVLTGAGERQTSPVSEAWVIADGVQKVDGKPYQWWRLVMKKRDGSILAVKALSEHVPMTSDKAPGTIVRYIFNSEPGVALEYIDESTGRALLPEIEFKRSFLPQPAPDARYSDGFASTGSLLGHVATKVPLLSGYPTGDFNNVRSLKIRTDFIIGTSRHVKDNGVRPKTPADDWNYVPWSKEDIKAMIDAGFNYFGPTPEMRPWVENEPVFFHVTPVFPDDFYRSNLLTSRMFIDEPMVRLGWTGHIPGSPSGPEVVAQALRASVASQETLRSRSLVPADKGSLGTLELFAPKSPAWETEYWSAWYQLQAGAPGIVHEGRYRHRGYGWEPESLLGEGLEGLTDIDQFNFYYAFLRGAARSFNGYWGTSLYGHSDVELRLPAFIRAYQMGAKHLWFWTSDHEHHMPFTEQLRIARAICDYARAHPRPSSRTTLRQAEVGIALPPGYAFNWAGIWGMDREQLDPAGVSYGDIAAAMVWEGIICSREGKEFDFLVDHPGIEKLGYKRLVRVQEDGTLRVTPPWPEKRAPKDLSVHASRQKGDSVSERQNATPQFRIQRAGRIKIDGDLSDWSNASWIRLDGSKWTADSSEVTAAPKGPETHSAEAAFLLDDDSLYFACRVKDDVQVQKKRGWDLWMNDSVQIGLDPILDRKKDNYGENDHEIGFALRDGKAVVWRWKGRRGQPAGEMKDVKAQVKRKGDETLYEAAIPLSELMPFAPDMWPKCGIDIVVNDSDGEDERKGRLELVPEAMTAGKHPDQFAVFECAPSPNPDKVSAALVWKKRCMPVKGEAELTLAVCSPHAKKAVVNTELTSLDTPDTKPAISSLTIPVTPEPEQYMLKVSSASSPGRYRLKVTVSDTADNVAAEDALNVYVYP